MGATKAHIIKEKYRKIYRKMYGYDKEKVEKEVSNIVMNNKSELEAQMIGIGFITELVLYILIFCIF